jgi:hypothetical protein
MNKQLFNFKLFNVWLLKNYFRYILKVEKQYKSLLIKKKKKKFSNFNSN